MSAGANPMIPEPVRVTSVRRETADVVTVTLSAAAARPFLPGQFNMLYAFGVGEAAISLSGDPGRPKLGVHTIKAVGAVTRALCRLKRSSVVGVRGPYGQPWPLDAARGGDLVLIAGGVGLAPLRSVIYEILRRRSSFGRVHLLVGARTPADLLYRRELARWEGLGRLNVLVTVDRAAKDWTGRVGVVPALLGELALSPRTTVAFVCGPEVMMRYSARELGRRGVPDERIHLALERNMKCAVGFCGHCQFGKNFVCKDGPIFRYDGIRSLLRIREI
jgi:NAD(P)H-flavin reductase